MLCPAALLLCVSGYTPLHLASGYMHTGPMAALLEAGADPLIKDKQGGRGGGGCTGMHGRVELGLGLVAQKDLLRFQYATLAAFNYRSSQVSNALVAWLWRS